MTDRREHFFDADGDKHPNRRRPWAHIGPGQLVLYAALAVLVVLFWRDSTNKSHKINHFAAVQCHNQQKGIAATKRLRIIVSAAEPLLQPSASTGDERLRQAFDDYLRITANINPPKTCPHD